MHLIVARFYDEDSAHLDVIRLDDGATAGVGRYQLIYRRLQKRSLTKPLTLTGAELQTLVAELNNKGWHGGPIAHPIVPLAAPPLRQLNPEVAMAALQREPG